MKKKNFIPLLSLFLSSCTNSILIPSTATDSQPLVSMTSNQLLTSTKTYTITPRLPTATFTGTPTFIYLDSATPLFKEVSPTDTLGLIISTTPNIIGTPPFQTVTPDSLFTTIMISGGRIYWGACEPSFVKITTHLEELSKVHTVTLWLRLENKTTGDTTNWGGGAIMDGDGQGNFTYTLTAKSFSHYREYLDAWGQYQLVASERDLHRIGASAQYLNNITVAPCP